MKNLIKKYEEEAEAHKRYIELYRHNKHCRDMFDIQNALYNHCQKILSDLKKLANG